MDSLCNRGVKTGNKSWQNGLMCIGEWPLRSSRGLTVLIVNTAALFCTLLIRDRSICRLFKYDTELCDCRTICWEFCYMIVVMWRFGDDCWNCIVAYSPVSSRWLCKQPPFLGKGSVNTFLLLRSRFLTMQQLDATIEELCSLCCPCRDVISKG
jgi:hypothetical protein